MSNVVYLQKPPPQIAHFLRIGHQDHVLCDHLRTVGKLTSRRFVFEAGNVPHQIELIRELKAIGAELVLDTNAAEQSVEGRFAGAVSDAPWAFKDRPLEREDFRANTNRSVIGPMARFAIKYGFHAGFAPAHYLGRTERSWLAIDCANCEALRIALDREGGKDIAIDYPLIVDNAQIKDQAFVTEVVEALRSLPIDYLWLRIAGFGSDATGAGIDKIIRATHSLRDLGIPIIVDQVGGLAGLALGSFGVASGFANGLKGKDRFDDQGWLVPRTGGGGNAKKVFLTSLDRRVTVAEIKSLFSTSTTARHIFGCRDNSCCGGVEAMLKEPEAHLVVQQGKALVDLSGTPESLRPAHFLRNYVGVAKSSAGRALKLRSASDEFQKLSEKASFRLDRMKDSLEMTSERLGIIDFTPETSLRSLQGKSQDKKGGNL